MQDYTFQGRVILVGEPRSGTSQRTGKNWASQDVTLEETYGQYPKRICVNVFGEDKIKALNFQVNEECIITFDINAQEYQGKWYNKLNCWKKEIVGQAQPQPQVMSTQQVPQPQAQASALPQQGQQVTPKQENIDALNKLNEKLNLFDEDDENKLLF